MKHFFSYFLALSFIALHWPQAQANDCIAVEACESHYLPNQFPHKFYVGPEFYRVRRTREGKSKQRGWIYGVRAGYDYIKRYKLYLGGDVLWGQGPLRGHSPSNKLKSTFTDTSVEGRIGYTLQNKYYRHVTVTPFVGFGYFEEKNSFHRNAPLNIKFKNRFKYGTAGFLSSLEIKPNLSLGLNFKAKFPYETKCRISDPELGGRSLRVKDRTHYRVEVPLSYWLCKCGHVFELGCIPFYEFRHYGKRENYPFDFLDTKLRNYGISFQIGYRL
ncbi:MAG: outer membrane protein [Parachlamydiaceae bacterium]